MGKSTEVDGDNNPTSPESDPTKLLEAALQQMDGIIAGECYYLCIIDILYTLNLVFKFKCCLTVPASFEFVGYI